jgi:hypothetical protein
MLMVSIVWYVDFYELFVLWVGNNYVFGGKGRGLGSFRGQVVRKYLKRDLQTFTRIVIFSLLL